MGRLASPTEKAWAKSRNSARQHETARPVKPAGQNGSARGPYHLLKQTARAQFFSYPSLTHSTPRHLTHCTTKTATLLLDSLLCAIHILASPPPTSRTTKHVGHHVVAGHTRFSSTVTSTTSLAVARKIFIYIYFWLKLIICF